MGMITVRSPKGREVRVSEKLFRSVYRSQGYRPMSVPVVVPASEAPVVVGEGPDATQLAVETPLADSGPPETEAITAISLVTGQPIAVPEIAVLSRAELNTYAESIGIANPASMGNKPSLLNLIGAHLREQGQG